jgi:hypothetical protein
MNNKDINHKLRFWESPELRKALSDYLNGVGLVDIAAECLRSTEGVRNMIKSDLPRNYRKCIGWLPPATFERAGKPWLIVEDKYLMRLRQQGRDTHDMVVILNRPRWEVEERLKASKPDRGEGFFEEEELGDATPED